MVVRYEDMYRGARRWDWSRAENGWFSETIRRNNGRSTPTQLYGCARPKMIPKISEKRSLDTHPPCNFWTIPGVSRGGKSGLKLFLYIASSSVPVGTLLDRTHSNHTTPAPTPLFWCPKATKATILPPSQSRPVPVHHVLCCALSPAAT